MIDSVPLKRCVMCLSISIDILKDLIGFWLTVKTRYLSDIYQISKVEWTGSILLLSIS